MAKEYQPPIDPSVTRGLSNEELNVMFDKMRYATSQGEVVAVFQIFGRGMDNNDLRQLLADYPTKQAFLNAFEHSLSEERRKEKYRQSAAKIADILY